MKKKFITIYLESFPANIYVGFGYSSLQEVANKIPQHKKEIKKADPIVETDYAATYCFGNKESCLLFKNHIYSIYELGYVVHEVMHITNHLMNYFGVLRSKKSDETHAYISQYIFGQIIKVYKDKRLCLKTSKDI